MLRLVRRRIKFPLGETLCALGVTLCPLDCLLMPVSGEQYLRRHGGAWPSIHVFICRELLKHGGRAFARHDV
jgi:hypothetical protein